MLADKILDILSSILVVMFVGFSGVIVYFIATVPAPILVKVFGITAILIIVIALLILVFTTM